MVLFHKMVQQDGGWMIHAVVTVFPCLKIVPRISGPFSIVLGTTPHLKIALGIPPDAPYPIASHFRRGRDPTLHDWV